MKNRTLSLGIDPGIANTGWSLCERDRNGAFTVVTGGVIRTDKRSSESQRLHKIFQQIIEVLVNNDPSLLVVENVYFNKNVSSALSTAGVASICLLAGEISNIATLSISPQQAKSAVTGSGSASKERVAKGVKQLTGKDFENSHINDSVAIAIAGILRSRSISLRIPKTRCVMGGVKHDYT